MNNSFLKNTSWIMIGRLIQLGLTFVTTMLVTRYLGPSEYGRLTYVFSYIQLFLPICTLGLNDIIVKTLIDNKKETDEIVGTVLGMRIIVSLFSMICSVALVSLINNDIQYRNIAILQSLSLLFYSFDSIIYFFQSSLLSKNVGIALSFSYILSSIYKIVGIVLHKDIMWFAFGMALDYIILGLVLFVVYIKNNHKIVFSRTWAKALLKKSSYYLISGLLVVIYGKVSDILLLGKLVDETNVGYYSAGVMLCNAWPFILTAIIDAANPIIIDLFNSDKELFKKRIRQLYCAIIYISLFVALGIFVLGDFAINLLYGKEYLPGVVPFKIYAFSTAFSYLGVARIAWMQCNNKTKYEIYIALFGTVVNIVLNYTLIKNYGINGAAIAAVLTQFLTNFVLMLIMKEMRENGKLILDSLLLKDVFK